MTDSFNVTCFISLMHLLQTRLELIFDADNGGDSNTGTPILRHTFPQVPAAVMKSSEATLAHINDTIESERDPSKVDDRQHNSDNVNRENAHYDAISHSGTRTTTVQFQIFDGEKILSFNTNNWQDDGGLILTPIISNVLAQTDTQTVLREVPGADPEEVQEDVPRNLTNMTWLISVDSLPTATGRSPTRSPKRRGAKLTRPNGA